MFTAIISTIIQWFSDIYWKKSLNYWVWWKAHDILSYLVAFLIIIYFFLSWIDLSNLDYYVLWLSFLVLLIAVFRTWIAQKIYKEEKMSVIMPYTNVNKILTIIFSFFIFSDVSILSLIITLIAISIIILFSIDFKTLKFPRNIWKILTVELWLAITTLLSWWIVIKYWEIIYFMLAALCGFFILFVLNLFLWEFKTLKWLPKWFWINRYIWSLWWLSWFLSLVVIKNLWLSVTVLLSFLWIWITLLLSYTILKDKPSGRNLLLTFIVTILVWIWFLLK